jgi:hypothetical protein
MPSTSSCSILFAGKSGRQPFIQPVGLVINGRLAGLAST